MGSLMAKERREEGRGGASQGSATESGITKFLYLGPSATTSAAPKSGAALDWQDADQALCSKPKSWHK